jgi:hypothetical protein
MGIDDGSVLLLGEFGTWLERQRGLAPESVRCYCNQSPCPSQVDSTGSRACTSPPSR